MRLFPFDKQRIGDMADVLNMKLHFDQRPEFQGHKEESARELYNWLREQERITEPAEPAPPTAAESPATGRTVEGQPG